MFISRRRPPQCQPAARRWAAWLCAVIGLIGPLPPARAADQPALYWERGHVDGAGALALSPDGKWLATAGLDNTVKLWDADNGRELRSFGDVGGPANAVAFSPDGKCLATAGRDRKVRLWNVEDGSCRAVFTGHRNVVACLAFSPDGAWLASGGYDFDVRLWDGRGGSAAGVVLGPHPGNVYHVAFSPDGKRVACGGNFTGGENGVYLWEIATRQRIVIPVPRSQPWNDTTSLAFCGPDRLAICGGGTGFVWDIGQARQTAELPDAESFALSADGKKLASLRADGTIRLTELSRPGGEQVVRPQVGKVARFVLGRDSAAVYVCGSDGEAKYLFGSSKAAWTCPNVDRSAHRFVVSPDERTIVGTNAAGTLTIWSLTEGIAIRDLASRREPIFSVAINLAGSLLAEASAAQPINVRAWPDGGLQQTLPGHEYCTRALGFSPDGRWLATAGNDKKVRVWDVGRQSLVRELTGFPGVVFAAAFDPSQKTLAVAASGQDTALYNTADWRERARLQGHRGDVQALAFSRDGDTLATGGSDRGGRDAIDRTVRLWDARSGKLGRILGQHRNNVHALAFSPDGATLASGDFSGELLLWDLRVGTPPRRLAGHTDSIESLAFIKDGRFLASGGQDGTIRFWDTRTGQERCALTGSATAGWTAIAPDGRFDTDNLDEIRGLHWTVPGTPLEVLPPEIYMRDYYEPRLLARLLEDSSFQAVRPLLDLNRAQPVVTAIRVLEPPSATGGASVRGVTVEVDVKGGTRAVRRDGKTVESKSGAYDLHLLRDGQLVRQSPTPPEDAPSLADGNGEAALEVWSASTKVLAGAETATVRFDNVLLSRRPGAVFSAYAFNSDRVKGPTFVQDKPPLAANTPSAEAKPKAYLVCMGVNRYSNPALRLRFAANDARQMIQSLAPCLTAAGYEVEPHLLLSENGGMGGTASKQALRFTLADVAAKATPDDLVLVSFSGHGHAGQDGEFYLVPAEAGRGYRRGEMPDARFLNQCVSGDELSRWIRRIDAGHMALVIDACHSAASVEQPWFKPGPMGSRGLGQLAYDKRMQVLAASQADDFAIESGILRQGLLTYALTHDGLQAGRADFSPADGRITLGEWLEYGAERVPKLHEIIKSGGKLDEPLLSNADTPSIGVLLGSDRTPDPGTGDGSDTKDFAPVTTAGINASSLVIPGAFQTPAFFDYSRGFPEVVLKQMPSPTGDRSQAGQRGN